MSDADYPSADGLLEAVCRTATQLAKISNRPLRRISAQSGDTTVEVEWAEAVVTAFPLPLATYEPASNGATSDEADVGLHYICSPMVGTFYVAPEPGAKPFVVEGDMVEPGQPVGILEAMKLMNAIEADRAGRVAEILVPNATSVEYGQRLIALAPLDES
ncbi:MAG: acetyl-CoA carboxylase biotin carboxyl carrier protein [Egibacteraceae bacterium]